MSSYHGTKSETFKAKCMHRIKTSNILESIMKIKWGGKNPHKILCTILAKSFIVYELSDGDKLVKVECVAVVCLYVFWLARGEHITLQLNEISGLSLRFWLNRNMSNQVSFSRCFSKYLNSPSYFSQSENSDLLPSLLWFFLGGFSKRQHICMWASESKPNLCWTPQRQLAVFLMIWRGGLLVLVTC